MKWQKLGLVFGPNNGASWMKTHAQVPTPLICDGFIRVYFGSRCQPNLSLISFVDIDIDDPSKILSVHQHPILEPGPPGTFDEHGMNPSHAICNDGRVWLYYGGWSRTTTVPYSCLTGLAISEDGGRTFRKATQGPVLGKNPHDPYSAAAAYVLRDDREWQLWYCSGTNWLNIDGKYEHTYDIKHAQSNDGVNWVATGHVAIAQRTPQEAVTRPWVLRKGENFHMWFCYRGSLAFRDGEDAYRMGYARSTNCFDWDRHDELVGLVPSESGWDCRMTAYPAVLEVGNRLLMFYNGNHFGSDGFGVAELEEFD